MRWEYFTTGLAFIGIGVTLMLALPPPGWLRMPPPLVHIGIIVGATLTLIGTLIAVFGMWPALPSPKIPVLGMGLTAILFVACAAWFWVVPTSPNIFATFNQPIGSILTPSQEQLLTVIAKYQRSFVVSKLIIGQDGKLYFDGDATKGKDVNFVIELYGSSSPEHQKNFVALMESIPLEYVRFFPEMRWNSPFVVSVTEHGMRYLRGEQ